MGLFLECLGVSILTPTRVRLQGSNPFPWPVTLKYRGLRVERRLDGTTITFPNGATVTVDTTEPTLVTA